MKAKTPSKTESTANSIPEIPSAYDIASALRECKEKGMKARRAIAWMENGSVQVSESRFFFDNLASRKSHCEIYQRWREEIGLTSNEPDLDNSRANLLQEVRYARCVAASNGERWNAWKEIDVRRFLLNPPGTPLEKCLSIVPIEYTIFDPDKMANVWVVEHETAPLPRCLEFGISLLSKTASVYCSAVDVIEGFEAAFEFSNGSEPWTPASRPAALLRDCKNAATRLIHSAELMRYQGKGKGRVPDPATALRQGFLVGTWLAQAEGIISNAKDMKLASQQGFSGQHTSKFWTWVIELQQTTLKGKTSAELFSSLEGELDPDFKGYKLQIVDDKLKRGNGQDIKLSGFAAALSRAKSRTRK